jgi:RNA polymerase sigma-70 factor, ECF subfamily
VTETELARFRAGEERLFEQIVREHSPRMLGVIRRLTSDPDEAADALQDAWLRAYARRGEFQGSGSLLGWLLTISRSVAVDRQRRARVGPEHRATRLEGDEHVPGMPFAAPGEAASEDEDARRRAMEAVLELPAQQREVVLHRLVEGRSTRETASALGCAEGTVKATLFQALRSLRRRLAQPSPSS